MLLFNAALIPRLLLCCLFLLVPPAGAELKPRVILLNGTGSVGKTSIARVLERTLDHAVFLSEEMLVFDAYRELMKQQHLKPSKPLNNLGEFLTYRQSLPVAAAAGLRRSFKEKGEAFMREDARRLLQHFTAEGKDVVIDRAMWEPEDFREWEEDTRGLSVFHVIVYCPLKDLLEHIQARNAGADPAEHRDPILPFEVFFHMYVRQLEPSREPVDVLYRQRTIDELRHAVAYNAAYRSDRKLLPSDGFVEDCLKKVQLDAHERVSIAPFFAYDLMVNTGLMTSAECAARIKAELQLRQAREKKRAKPGTAPQVSIWLTKFVKEGPPGRVAPHVAAPGQRPRSRRSEPPRGTNPRSWAKPCCSELTARLSRHSRILHPAPERCSYPWSPPSPSAIRDSPRESCPSPAPVRPAHPR